MSFDTHYHLVTFTRRGDGTLSLWFGKVNGVFMGSYDPRAKAFMSERPIGRFNLPSPMTAEEAREWVNDNFPLLHQKFPDVPEFK